MYSTNFRNKITSFLHQNTSLCITMPPRTADVSSACTVHSTPTSSPIFHYLTAKQQLVSSEKQVRFNQNVDVRLHIHLHNYTDEEFEATFYVEAEYAVIKLECREIVRGILQTAMHNKNSTSGRLDTILEEESPPSCHWGLERKLNPGVSKMRRYQAIDFVMEEQDRQWIVGTEEPDKIFKAYSEISDLCQAEAHRTGLQDQQDQEQSDF
jgi:hypothetical protein